MYLEIQLSRAPVFAPRIDANSYIVPNTTLDEREKTTPWRFFGNYSAAPTNMGDFSAVFG